MKSGIILALALLATPAFAQEDLFEGLEKTGAAAPRATAQPVPRVQVQEEPEEDFTLFRRAISEARWKLFEASKDSKGRGLFDPDYSAYDGLDSSAGVRLAGKTFQATSANLGGSGMHDLALETRLAKDLTAPLPYLKALARRMRGALPSLLALYEREILAIASAKLRGPESRWHELPPRAWKLALGFQGRLELLEQMASFGSGGRVTAAQAARVEEPARKLMAYLETAFGLSADGSKVDLERARSAYQKIEGGNVLTGRQYKYGLKPELAAGLEQLAGRSSELGNLAAMGNPFAVILRSVAWSLTQPLQTAPRLSLLDSHDALTRRAIGIRLFYAHSRIKGLFDLVSAFETRS